MPSVLIVDDHPATLMLTQATLSQSAGWQFFVATDGIQALTLIAQKHEQIDVMLLDVFLPGIDGRVLYTQTQTLAPDLPVIAMSGDAAALTELAQRGCSATLRKPLIRAELLEAIHQAVVSERTHQRAITSPALLPFDQRVVAEAEAPDLDLTVVERHAHYARKHRGYTGTTEPVEFLIMHKGAVRANGMVLPTYAGLLAFGRHPERFVPRCGVEIAQFAGELPALDALRHRQTVYGPLLAMIPQAVDVLVTLTTNGNTSSRSSEQSEASSYARSILRELTLNALCHRDWSLEGASVQVRVFDNRIEWTTPGGLPEGMSIANLREAQVSRNTTLSNFLYQAGLMQRLGIGMDSVYDSLQQGGFARPFAHNQDGWFTFSVTRMPISQKHSPRKSVVQQSLTLRQEQILGLLTTHGTLMAQDIVRLLGEPLRTIQRDVAILIEQQQIESVGSTRSRRYRRFRSPGS